MAELSWRRLERADLPLLEQWFREPLVARWWNHDASPAGVERDFGPSVRGDEAGEDLVVELDGVPVGLVQRSRLGDYLEDLTALSTLDPVDALDAEMVELDYLIGVAELRGQGLGPRIIAAVLAETWLRYPLAPAVVISVVASNRASWRAAEKAGLRRVAEGDLPPENPVDPPRHFLYRAERPSSA